MSGFSGVSLDCPDMHHMDQINWFLHGMSDELRPLCITNSMGVPWTDLEALIQYAYAKDRMLRAAGVSSHGRPRESKRSWVSNKDKHPRHTHVAAPLPLSHAGVGPQMPSGRKSDQQGPTASKRQALPGTNGRPALRGGKPSKPSIVRNQGARDNAPHHMWSWMRNYEADICVRDRICVCCYEPISNTHKPGRQGCGFTYSNPCLPVQRAKLGLPAGR